MSLTRWDPFRELEEMSDRLNRLMRGTGEPTGDGRERLTVADWAPKVDIAETDGEYLIKAELPEIQKKDVSVTVGEGVLTIQGERKQERDENGPKFHRIERSYGTFLRRFTMPENVDEAKVSAEFKDGVLRLRLPKSEKAKPKAIDVTVA